jgi:hypothetical protein
MVNENLTVVQRLGRSFTLLAKDFGPKHSV